MFPWIKLVSCLTLGNLTPRLLTRCYAEPTDTGLYWDLATLSTEWPVELSEVCREASDSREIGDILFTRYVYFIQHVGEQHQMVDG